MELDPLQMILIGLVASAITQVLKVIAARLGYEAPRELVTAVLFLVSAVLAFIFLKPTLPDPGSPTFITDLVTLATAILGAAVVIYNILLDKVYPALKLTVERNLSKG